MKLTTDRNKMISISSCQRPIAKNIETIFLSNIEKLKTVINSSFYTHK